MSGDSIILIVLSLFAFLFNPLPVSHPVSYQVNNYRREIGKEDFIWDYSMKRACYARLRTNIRNGYISHKGWSEEFRRNMDTSHFYAIGENLAFGYDDSTVLQAWIESESHKEQLDSDMTHNYICSKFAEGYGMYYVHLFGEK